MNHEDRLSVPALIVYAALLLVFLAGAGVFLLVANEVKVQGDLMGILGAFLTFLYGLANMAVGYFVGSSTGAKTANAAVAQIAAGGGKE